jgi:hypothetical protein
MMWQRTFKTFDAQLRKTSSRIATILPGKFCSGVDIPLFIYLPHENILRLIFLLIARFAKLVSLKGREILPQLPVFFLGPISHSFDCLS